MIADSKNGMQLRLPTHNNLSDSCKKGNYQDAIIGWQKALDIEPDHPEIIESIQAAMERLKSGE